MNTQDKPKERFEEKIRLILLPCELVPDLEAQVTHQILAFIEKELTTQKNEIVEIGRKVKMVNTDDTCPRCKEDGSQDPHIDLCNHDWDEYNQGIEDFKSKILNK